MRSNRSHSARKMAKELMEIKEGRCSMEKEPKKCGSYMMKEISKGIKRIDERLAEFTKEKSTDVKQSQEEKPLGSVMHKRIRSQKSLMGEYKDRQTFLNRL